MDLTVRFEDGQWTAALDDGRRFRCAIGRGGVQSEKREGDGVTPVGSWPVRRLLYRPDRVSVPETALPSAAIRPQDGWCDDPADSAYNRPVTLPYSASHEQMWRDDRLYDLVVILGHNDDPPVPGAGSAIFLHVARPDFTATEGCIALQPEALHLVLGELSPESRIHIEAAES